CLRFLAPLLLFLLFLSLLCLDRRILPLVRGFAASESVVREDDADCLEAPVTLAVAVGGRDCSARLPSVERLRTMLYSLEEASLVDEEGEGVLREGGGGPGASPIPPPGPIHLLLWLESGDDTTLKLVEEVGAALTSVASVTAIDVGNATTLTLYVSPLITTSFVYRRYDWVKFLGIHRPDPPRRHVLNVDIDAIFLRPASEVWRDGCAKLSGGPGEAVFYVAGQEFLSDNPHFDRYVNSGVAFLDLRRRAASYNHTELAEVLVPDVAGDKNLTTRGQWPPEQWLWNALFQRRPEYLALFRNVTQCNCASHKTFPGVDQCKLAHYCNTKATSLFDDKGRFSSSLADYVRRSLPGLFRRVASATPLKCPAAA
ncbi:hypothetical protein ACHAWF_003191, partial [Thalassiosira exigua]